MKNQIYDAEGNWAGFFVDEKTAEAWLKKNPTHTLSDVSPVQEQRRLALEARAREEQTEVALEAGDPVPA